MARAALRLVDTEGTWAKGVPPALLIKAWNLWREGKPALRTIMWKHGGTQFESFPVPK